MNTLALICLLASWGTVDLQPDPPASDLRRFPPSQLVEDWASFRRLYLQGLRDRWLWDLAQRPALLEALSEAESAWAPWDTLQDAIRADRYGWTPEVCRRHLGSLRRQLGEDAYAAGRLPPPCRCTGFGTWIDCGPAPIDSLSRASGP